MSYTNEPFEEIELKEYDDEEIRKYEQLGKQFTIDKNKKKKELRNKIRIENMNIIEEKLKEEFEDDEYIETQFEAYPSGMHYFSSLSFSADNQLAPMAMGSRDIGHKFIVYATNKKIIFYEVRQLNILTREYEIDYKDIKKFKVKRKADYIYFSFHCEKDKYDQFRMANSFWAYILMDRKLKVNTFAPNREEIADKLEQLIN